MINSRVLSILRSFRKKELKDFGFFLQSSYFHRDKKAIKLYGILIKYYPSFRNEELENKKLYKTLYGSNKCNNSTLTNLFFHLMTSLEKYLVIKNIFRKDADYRFSLVEELTLRGFNNLTPVTLKKLDQHLKSRKTDSTYFYDLFQFNTWQFNYFASSSLISNAKQLIQETEALRDMTVNLVKYFILNITNAFLNNSFYDDNAVTNDMKLMFKDLILFFNIKELMRILSKKNDGYFILEIYSALVDTFLNKDDEKYYYLYRDLVSKYAGKLSVDEIAFHFSTLIGYSTLRKNQNNKFGDELIELYKTMLVKKYYIDNKTAYLLPERYREILLTALDMKQFVWVNSFIEKYSKRLPPGDVENMYNLGKGYYYFSTVIYAGHWII